jgi:hypothetical protein
MKHVAPFPPLTLPPVSLHTTFIFACLLPHPKETQQLHLFHPSQHLYQTQVFIVGPLFFVANLLIVFSAPPFFSRMDAQENSSDGSDSKTSQPRAVSSTPAVESAGQRSLGEENRDGNSGNGNGGSTNPFINANPTSPAESWPAPDFFIENQDYAGFGQFVSQAVDSTSLKEFFSGISHSVLRSLYPNNPSDAPKNIKKLKLFIKDMDGVAHCTDLTADGCKEVNLHTKHVYQVKLTTRVYPLNDPRFTYQQDIAKMFLKVLERTRIG